MQPTGASLVLALLIFEPQAVLAVSIDVISNIVLLSYVGICGVGYAGLIIFCAWKCFRRRPATDIAYRPIDSPPLNAYTVSVVPTDDIDPAECPIPPFPPPDKDSAYFPPTGVLPAHDQYNNSEGYDQPIQFEAPVTAVLHPAANATQNALPTVYEEPVKTISTPIPVVQQSAASVTPGKNSPPPSYESIYTS